MESLWVCYSRCFCCCLFVPWFPLSISLCLSAFHCLVITGTFSDTSHVCVSLPLVLWVLRDQSSLLCSSFREKRTNLHKSKVQTWAPSRRHPHHFHHHHRAKLNPRAARCLQQNSGSPPSLGPHPSSKGSLAFSCLTSLASHTGLHGSCLPLLSLGVAGRSHSLAVQCSLSPSVLCLLPSVCLCCGQWRSLRSHPSQHPSGSAEPSSFLANSRKDAGPWGPFPYFLSMAAETGCHATCRALSCPCHGLPALSIGQESTASTHTYHKYPQRAPLSLCLSSCL